MRRIIDFDDRGKAHVSEQEFTDYVEQDHNEGDYTIERYDMVFFFNSGKCLLAEYDRKHGYGQLF